MSKDGVNPNSDDRLRPVHQYLKEDNNGNLILDKNGVVQTVTEDFDDDDFVDGQFIPLVDSSDNEIKRDANGDLYVSIPEYQLDLGHEARDSGTGTAIRLFRNFPNAEGSPSGAVSRVQFIGNGGTVVDKSFVVSGAEEGNGSITITSPDIPNIPTTDASYALTVESTTVDGVTTQSRNWDDSVIMTGDLTAPFSSDPPNDQTDILTQFTASETFPVDFYTSGNTGEVRAGVNIGEIISGLGGIQTRLSITEAISKWDNNNDYVVGQLVIFTDVVYRRIDTELIVSAVVGTVLEPTADDDWMAITDTAANIKGIKDTADTAVQSITIEGELAALQETGGNVTIPSRVAAGRIDGSTLRFYYSTDTSGVGDFTIVLPEGSVDTVVKAVLLDGNTLELYYSDVTTGDPDLMLDLSGIDHDALANYVANEHIDWTTTQTENIDSGNYTDTIPNDSTISFKLNDTVLSGSFTTNVGTNVEIDLGSTAVRDWVSYLAGAKNTTETTTDSSVQRTWTFQDFAENITYHRRKITSSGEDKIYSDSAFTDELASQYY